MKRILVFAGLLLLCLGTFQTQAFALTKKETTKKVAKKVSLKVLKIALKRQEAKAVKLRLKLKRIRAKIAHLRRKNNRIRKKLRQLRGKRSRSKRPPVRSPKVRALLDIMKANGGVMTAEEVNGRKVQQELVEVNKRIKSLRRHIHHHHHRHIHHHHHRRHRR